MSRRLLLVAVLAFVALPAVTAAAVTQQIKVISVTVSTVSHDVGTMTSTGGAKTKITVRAVFPKIGTITYSGPFVTRKDRTTVVPITGGTGAFKGATGTVVIGAGEKKSPNTYIVTVPHALDLNSSGVA